MNLSERLTPAAGGGVRAVDRRGRAHGVEARSRASATPSRASPPATRPPSSKARVHGAVVSRLGAEIIYGSEGGDDLAERVRRAVREELTPRPHAAVARRAPADRARDRRRRAGLRAARAVPPRRHRHRDHGQRARARLHRAQRQDQGDGRHASSTRTTSCRIIDRIVSRVGRRIDEASPMVDARLPDGSRVNAIVPPLALHGPSLTIRKFSRDPYTAEDLIALRHAHARRRRSSSTRASAASSTSSSPAARAPARRRCSTPCRPSSPSDERIVTIEDAAELQLQQRHVVALEARPAEHRGPGRGPHPRPRPQRAAHAPRPHHRRRGPRRRGARHAPGDEHRPRRLADHDPRQHAARRAPPPRDAGAHGRRRAAAARRSASRSRRRST